MQWTVTPEEAGLTVKEQIRRHVKLSSKMLKFLKYREDGILVNGVRVTVRYTPKAGDTVSLQIPDGESAKDLIPVELPIDILYEDDDMVIPAKPAAMPTHPSRDHTTDTVANALAYRYRERGIPFVFRPINRLDRDTSGLLLVARNKLSAGALTEYMQSGRIRKSYLAMLCGEDCPEHGVIDAPLHRSADSIIVREVCSPDAPDAEPSRTEYEILARQNGYTLVKASPITGRTHQLRVHFASIGHPIAGDTLYGSSDPYIPRQALHAYELTLPSLAEDRLLHFRAPIPQDLQRLLAHAFPQWTPDERKEP